VDDAHRPTSVSHGPIDRTNEFWVEVRGAHHQLNDAVGWERWRPEKLDGAADRLRAVAPLDTELGGKALEAADLIDAATRTHDRDDAVQAHRVVNDIETLLQRRR
jgi:hypothetical protein